MTIAVTGSMAFDTLLTFSGSFTDYILPDQIERLSVSFLVNSMRKERGGVAGNIVYSLAMWNEHPLLMAAVGRDSAEYLTDLSAMGVDTSGVLTVPDEFTASFMVSTDRFNRQIANFYIGAMVRSTAISFHDYLHHHIDLAIISPNSPDAMMQYVRECKALSIPYVFDPSQQIPLISPQDTVYSINGASMLVVNDYEFGLIQQRTGLSIKDITDQVQALVITRGEHGSTVYAGKETFDIPIVPLSFLADPTGAGDAYRAGLLIARHYNLSWLEAGRVGALTAAYALEHIGTQKHSYTVQSFAERYFANFEKTATMQAFFNARQASA